MLLKRFSWIESKISSTHSLCLPIHCNRRNICKQGESYEHFDPRGIRSMHHLKVSYSSYRSNHLWMLYEQRSYSQHHTHTCQTPTPRGRTSGTSRWPRSAPDTWQWTRACPHTGGTWYSHPGPLSLLGSERRLDTTFGIPQESQTLSIDTRTQCSKSGSY